ncbi:MAG TPA: hypothetical protein VLI69_08240 [Gammaproteobacteria bacterium]|nr:hypothetical protein [Gammaproteobacteria bacterium]
MSGTRTSANPSTLEEKIDAHRASMLVQLNKLYTEGFAIITSDEYKHHAPSADQSIVNLQKLYSDALKQIENSGQITKKQSTLPKLRENNPLTRFINEKEEFLKNKQVERAINLFQECNHYREFNTHDRGEHCCKTFGIQKGESINEYVRKLEKYLEAVLLFHHNKHRFFPEPTWNLSLQSSINEIDKLIQTLEEKIKQIDEEQEKRKRKIIAKIAVQDAAIQAEEKAAAEKANAEASRAKQNGTHSSGTWNARFVFAADSTGSDQQELTAVSSKPQQSPAPQRKLS